MVRFGIPSIFVASVTVVMTVVAAVATAPLAALPMLLGVPLYWLSTRATCGMPARATCGSGPPTPASTASSPRPSTVPAPSTPCRWARRHRRFNEALRDCYDAERYTLGLRLRWFPAVEFGYWLPVAGAVLWGGLLAMNGHVSAGAATAVTLYIHQMIGPLDDVLMWLDEIQVGATSLARIIGVGEVRRTASPRVPPRAGTTWTSTTCTTPTGAGTTCCGASPWASCPASAWPSSGRRAPASRPWAA